LRAEDRTDADGDGHATRIGFAKHVVELEPARPWFPLDALRAYFENAVFNDAVMHALSGEIRLSIPGARAVRRRVPELKGSSDWFGLNYYTRWQVKMFESDPHVARTGTERTDLGWEIRPRGLGEVAARAASFTGLPVLVTEHGFADGADSFRPRALVESLMHLGEAIEHGVPVLGYLHWSLLDNFEWTDGYRGRFGLYRVDFGAPARTRTRTRSADLYARIARANAITSDVAGEAGLAL
jgi:beta-glucosidase